MGHLCAFYDIYLQRFRPVASRSLAYIESADGTLAVEPYYMRESLHPRRGPLCSVAKDSRIIYVGLTHRSVPDVVFVT